MAGTIRGSPVLRCQQVKRLTYVNRHPHKQKAGASQLESRGPGCAAVTETDCGSVEPAPGRTLEPGPSSQLTLCWREPDSNHRSRRERDGRREAPRPTIVVSRDDLRLMIPHPAYGPAPLVGNAERRFHKSGTDGSNPIPPVASLQTFGPQRELGAPSTHDLIGVVVFTLSLLNRLQGGRGHACQALLDRRGCHRPRARALGTLGSRDRSVHLPRTRATPGGHVQPEAGE